MHDASGTAEDFSEAIGSLKSLAEATSVELDSQSDKLDELTPRVTRSHERIRASSDAAQKILDS